MFVGTFAWTGLLGWGNLIGLRDNSTPGALEMILGAAADSMQELSEPCCLTSTLSIRQTRRSARLRCSRSVGICFRFRVKVDLWEGSQRAVHGASE